MRIRDRVWAMVRPIPVAIMGKVRKHPAIHKPLHALAVKATRFELASQFIQAVLEEHYLTDFEYQRWIADNDTLSDADRAAIAAHVARMADPPTISLVMPVYATEPRHLREAIASVKGQLYPHWELCIADDASPGAETWALLEAEAAGEPRIRLVRRPVNGHISAASNSALALATGAFIAPMDHDDLLAPNALYEIAAELADHPQTDLLYSDEDKIDDQGHRFEPHFKTGWNPELLLGQNMVKHLCVVRRSVAEAIGGFREGFEGSQDFDLALRLAEAVPPARIRHVPAILYHWRQGEGGTSFSQTALERCRDAAQRAVSEHLARTGAAGAVVEPLTKAPAYLVVKRPAPSPLPLVSVIVPTRDRASLLKRCIEGVLEKTAYGPLELIVVDNDSVEPETHALFRKIATDPRVRILPAPGPFNYSAINNAAVAQAKGEVIVLLNNDVAVIEPDWLTHMVAQAVRPEVGAVGARLLYADGRMQHGGVILGVGGGGNPHVAGHLYSGARSVEKSYFNHLRLARNVSAVTAACLAMRKAVFDEVGGLDAGELAVAFNDVDLCLKIGAAGYRIVWTPLATLYHLESASRGSDETDEKAQRFRREVEVMRRRWAAVLDDDPFYGPNFDKQHVDYRLATPPGRVRPWRR